MLEISMKALKTADKEETTKAKITITCSKMLFINRDLDLDYVQKQDQTGMKRKRWRM